MQKSLLEREVKRYLQLERSGDIGGKSVRKYYAERVLDETKQGVQLPSRSSFFVALKKKREGLRLVQRGKPSALTSKEKKLLVDRLADFESRFNNCLTNEVIKQEAGYIVLSRLRKVTDKDERSEVYQRTVKSNLATVFRSSFVYPFRKLYASQVKTSRGMEVARARKLQPEICLQWFRLYLHGCALRQLQVMSETSDKLYELYE